MTRKVFFYSNICNKDSPNYSIVSLMLLCLFLSLSKLLYRFWFSRTEWLVLRTWFSLWRWLVRVGLVPSFVLTRSSLLVLSDSMTSFVPLAPSFILTRYRYMVLSSSLTHSAALVLFSSLIRSKQLVLSFWMTRSYSWFSLLGDSFVRVGSLWFNDSSLTKHGSLNVVDSFWSTWFSHLVWLKMVYVS